jgi:hypothetical protein
MEKIISQEKIDNILKLIYELNCPAPQWEAVKKLLAELPIKETKNEKNKA